MRALQLENRECIKNLTRLFFGLAGVTAGPAFAQDTPVGALMGYADVTSVYRSRGRRTWKTTMQFTTGVI
jgi:hypothetical protein